MMITGAELACLALTVYFEARGEDFSGQVAVAQVVLNRVDDERYPDSVCAVAYQGGEGLGECQFSWYCDGKSDNPIDAISWDNAMIVADLAAKFTLLPWFQGITHYHADYVSPYWAESMELAYTLGRHRFYR